MALPFPVEAVVGAGGVSMVEEEVEQDFDGTQIDCAVMGGFIQWFHQNDSDGCFGMVSTD